MRMTPSSNSARLAGIDLARGIAIAGMILEHFNQVIGVSPYIGPNWLVWPANHMDGRSAPMFIMLAGIGMSLSGRSAWLSGDIAERAAVRSGLRRRALVLFIAGLLLHFAWSADILHYFGVYIAAGSLLLFSRSRWLWAGTIVLNAGCVLALLLFDSSEIWCYDAGWNWDTLEYAGFWSPVGFLRNLLLNGWFPVFPWMGFLLVGIWMGRQKLNDRRFRLRCMLWGGLVAAAVGWASWLLENRIGPELLGIPDDLDRALFGLDPLPPTPFFTLQSGATAIFMIALCLELADRFADSPRLRPWLIFGQYSLSIYIVHIGLLIAPLYWMDLVGFTLRVTIPMGIAAVAVSLAFCTAWHKRFTRGPLEIILHRFARPGFHRSD